MEYENKKSGQKISGEDFKKLSIWDKIKYNKIWYNLQITLALIPQFVKDLFGVGVQQIPYSA